MQMEPFLASRQDKRPWQGSISTCDCWHRSTRHTHQPNLANVIHAGLFRSFVSGVCQTKREEAA